MSETDATGSTELSSPSFAKGLFVGELHQDLVTPYPAMDREERRKVADLSSTLHTIADEHYGPRSPTSTPSCARSPNRRRTRSVGSGTSPRSCCAGTARTCATGSSSRSGSPTP